MRRALIGLGLIAVGILVAAFAEPLAPRVELTGVTDTIGRGTPMRVVASDRGSGLAEVQLAGPPAGARQVWSGLASLPRWIGLGLAGTALVLAGARIEWLRGEGGRARAWLRELR